MTRPRLGSLGGTTAALELPPLDIPSEDSPPSPPVIAASSPSHRRSVRQYSLPGLNLNFPHFKFAKEDSKRSPTSPSTEMMPPPKSPAMDRPAKTDKKSKSPSRGRKTPTKFPASRALRRFVEADDDGHESDPGPSRFRRLETEDDDEDDEARPLASKTNTIASYSLYLPDSCSGLKDQFLRIKERFTKPMQTPSPAAGGVDDNAPASPMKKSTIGSLIENDVKDRRRLTADLGGWIDPRDLLDPTRNEEIAMKPMELMHELTKLNTSAQKLFADDPWSHGAERWVLEESHLRGYMTCWTIERGGELVVIIAQTIKNLNANIHPDISLQWIGRQLYGLTVQLPLAHSKELSMEHITVASGIDVALAKMLSLPEPSPTSWPASSFVVPPSVDEDMPMRVADPVGTLRREVPQPTSSLPMKPSSLASLPPHKDDMSPTKSRNNHMRSLSTDAAAAAMGSGTNGNGPMGGSGTLPLTRSLSSDLRTKSIGSGQLPIVPLSATAVAPTTPARPNALAAASIKTQTALATPATTALFEDDPFQRCTPDKTGWLKKRSSGLNSWQLRWFELKGNRLYYFKSEKDGIPRGAIILDKVHCVRGDAGELAMSLTISPSSGDFICMLKFSNRMTYHSYSRRCCTLRVADDGDGAESDLYAWINAICRASFHCYLALPPSPQGKLKQLHTKKSDNEMYKYSSFQYLRETDPLLWEINPLDQSAIRKKAGAATSTADYTLLFAKFATVLKHIVLPRPRPISIEQTLRDIIPELFLINNILYGGGETESIDHIFEVLEGYVRRFTPTHDECVHIVSSILQACARTIAGGDSYFVVRTLLGSPSMVIRPADNHGMPIVIDISSANPAHFTITLQSVFLFHTIEDIERMGEEECLEPTCRVQTLHVQEIDFDTHKSTRHLKIRHLQPEEEDTAMDRDSHSSRSADHDYGALLDGLG
ncbi:Aste57867_21497 [Aphanomyces stellatus]|uniref:Aste57867_21497 protein n=1 Tax=Aphanomyces stellatus TaxID=120398 RepID=A0A485LIB0_9STRA|nr:hypothetical protein As57867_021428 [Aphanomyces stellatus]VFT98167.1 Aste57867_21497 [Aphanomyces stellatus]